MIILITFFIIPDTNRSLFAMFFQSHNIGKVLLTVDGKEIKLDNIDITLTCENSESTSKIKNGKFKFRKGDHGKNMCSFTIPSEIYNGKIDVICEVLYISSNNWHINDFNINISITTDDEIKVLADGFVKTKSEKEPYYFDAFSKKIKECDNIISLYASGI